MRFVHKQIVELPFILNLPKGNYEVKMPEGLRILRVHHGLYAASASAFEYGSPLAVATKEIVRDSFPDPAAVSLHQLRTVVERVVTSEINSLRQPKDSDLLDEVSRDLIRSRDHTKAGKELKGEAAVRLAQMSVADRDALTHRIALRLTAREVFRAQTSEHFLLILNTFIRQYMVTVDDFFAEEVALHHVASTTLGGIHEVTLCDDTLIDSVTTVGKVPPVMRQPWFEHESSKVESLRSALKSGQPADAIALLGIRARGLLERGAYRSAIVEAAAALETAVARRLIVGLVAQGRTQDEAINYLHQNQRFSERCKKLFQSVIGISLAIHEPALWDRVVGHRDQLRHKIVHSDEEPSARDATAVVEDFLALARVAQSVS